jgi:hypothetical protein
VVTHNGEVSPLAPDFIVKGAAGDRIIDPTGAVELEVSFAGKAGAFAGRLKPDGTGAGTARATDGDTGAWTAKRIAGAEPAARQLAPAVEAEEAVKLTLQPAMKYTLTQPAVSVERNLRLNGHALNLGTLFQQPNYSLHFAAPTLYGKLIAAAPGGAPTGVAVLLELARPEPAEPAPPAAPAPVE